MVLLESDSFLTELTRLFQKCRTSGSIYLTMKKYDGRTKPVPRKGNPDTFDPADNKCLLRATDGKKKISTVISSKEVNRFQMFQGLRQSQNDDIVTSSPTWLVPRALTHKTGIRTGTVELE
ncbi:signal recognition particle 14 kDa protein isoform X1 [Carcharodon carcharias]|uniref:signal recognition particle 14 kDa protein isoform X1 n=1 Tax=Carcharodon carcharias TaxID=13397 RepID=UPI001B7DDF19|nr:signal recognition particle 14 kDa protein isoform X1 [Carcharodon carcharias]